MPSAWWQELKFKEMHRKANFIRIQNFRFPIKKTVFAEKLWNSQICKQRFCLDVQCWHTKKIRCKLSTKLVPGEAEWLLRKSCAHSPDWTVCSNGTECWDRMLRWHRVQAVCIAEIPNKNFASSYRLTLEESINWKDSKPSKSLETLESLNPSTVQLVAIGL